MATSAPRKKHATENPVTLAHLHVMALEKFVLEKLGKNDELKFLEEEYQGEPRYKRGVGDHERGRRAGVHPRAT